MNTKNATSTLTEATAPAETFIDIVRDLYDLLSADLPTDELRLDEPLTIQIEQGGINFLIGYHGQRNGKEIALICDMGAAPEDPEAQRAAFARILEINAHLALERAGMFCLQPGINSLLFCHDLPLEGQTARALLATISALADQARRWQADAFATAATPASGSSGDGWMRA